MHRYVVGFMLLFVFTACSTGGLIDTSMHSSGTTQSGIATQSGDTSWDTQANDTNTGVASEVREQEFTLTGTDTGSGSTFENSLIEVDAFSDGI